MVRARLQTLRGRLLLVLGTGLAALLVALAVNAYQLRTIGLSLEVVNRVYLPLAALSTRMGGQLDPSRDGAEAMARAVEEARKVVANAPHPPDAEETAALGATRVRVDALTTAYQQWKLASPGDPGPRVALRTEILQLNALVQTRISAVTVRTGRTQDAALRQAGVFVLVALVMSGALLYLAGAALEPVTRLTDQARQMAAGEKVAPIVLPGSDEIATLAGAFAQMAQAVDDRDRNLSALSLYLRRVLDSIGAAVAVAEGDKVRMANPPARALWQVDEDDPLPGWLGDLPEGRHEALRVEDRFHDVVVRPFGDGGRILVGEDTTERVRDRERLARSERLALMGQMLAQVTHEVRNPLNAMSLHAELLGDELDSDEARAVLGVIIGEIRRLEQVTGRYLDLARRRPTERSPEDPVLLARAVVALEEAPLTRSRVVASVEGEPGTTVDIDGNVLRQALLNLLRNAAEAGARHVVVAVAIGPHSLTCSVTDDGPGMTPEVAARVFDPFYTTRPRGTGLGLAITRQAVEDIDGQIECITAPGEGCSFRITLPLER